MFSSPIPIQLGVNIDHVATVRNARGGALPDPVKLALLAEEAGADGITAHLREDRRHIKDADLWALKTRIKTRLNMEMAATEEMVQTACELHPYMCTLVPERRAELTTEGGLDVAGQLSQLTPAVARLNTAGIYTSLFIDPDPGQIHAAQVSGAGWVEFHTGPYCHAFAKGDYQQELDALMEGARLALSLGLRVNAGHGLDLQNVRPILALPGLEELNIGHSLIAHAIEVGLLEAVRAMKRAILGDS